VAAERVWTSTKPFSDGREFCSIFNQAIREDSAAVAHTLPSSPGPPTSTSQSRGGLLLH
jgi:hypothetical protein